MKICCMSDLHGYLPKDIEPCEVVFICGDISPLNIQANSKKLKKWLVNEFKSWCESLPCDKVIFIAGNHDLYLENHPEQENFSKNDKVTYLYDDLYVYTDKVGKEYKIYGTPWCKQFGNWSFMTSQEELAQIYQRIPTDLDVLLTHDQPYGYGDILLQPTEWNTWDHIGNIALRDAVLLKQPKYLFCGHLHSTSHECVDINQTKRYNVSLKNEYYEPIYKPLYLEI